MEGGRGEEGQEGGRAGREGGREGRREGMYLAQIAVELSRETEGAGGAAHGGGDEVV